MSTVAPVAFEQVNACSTILAQRNRSIAFIYVVLASVSSESGSGAVTVVRYGAYGATGSERALGNLALSVVIVAQPIRFGTAAPSKVRAGAGAARQRGARIHYELARLARISGRTLAGRYIHRRYARAPVLAVISVADVRICFAEFSGKSGRAETLVRDIRDPFARASVETRTGVAGPADLIEFAVTAEKSDGTEALVPGRHAPTESPAGARMTQARVGSGSAVDAFESRRAVTGEPRSKWRVLDAGGVVETRIRRTFVNVALAPLTGISVRTRTRESAVLICRARSTVETAVGTTLVQDCLALSPRELWSTGTAVRGVGTITKSPIAARITDAQVDQVTVGTVPAGSARAAVAAAVVGDARRTVLTRRPVARIVGATLLTCEFRPAPTPVLLLVLRQKTSAVVKARQRRTRRDYAFVAVVASPSIPAVAHMGIPDVGAEGVWWTGVIAADDISATTGCQGHDFESDSRLAQTSINK